MVLERAEPPLHKFFSLCRIIEKIKTISVDFKKAFDSIKRVVMFKFLPLYGIPEQTISAIEAL